MRVDPSIFKAYDIRRIFPEPLSVEVAEATGRGELTRRDLQQRVVAEQAVDGLAFDGDVSHVDGISVSYPDWHFNVRPSNPEPLLRLNLEGRTRELMEAKNDEIPGIIRGE